MRLFWRTGKKTKPRRTVWRKVKPGSNDPQEEDYIFSQTKPQNLEDDSLHFPYEYFNMFIDDDILDIFVEQSNIQKDLAHHLKLSKSEFESWLGLSLMFSLSKINNTR